MASLDNTIKTTTLKKPLVVIKKGSIFKPDRPIYINLKRPITNASAASIDTNAKKTCFSVCSVQSGETSIISKIKNEVPTSNTHNAAVGLIKSVVTNINILPNNHKDVPDYVRIRVPMEPNKRCQKHAALPEHCAEGLARVGSTFKSPEAFKEYAAKNANKWYFYYKCCSSKNVMNSPNYNKKKRIYIEFGCQFNKQFYISNSKGIRKRSSVTSSVNCPARLTLRLDVGEDLYKVEYVCHHHSHELSAEIFSQISHGYRLPQEIKNEIRDLALLNVDRATARRYIESKTPGMNLRNTVYNTFNKFKRKPNKDIMMSPERIKEMLAKVKYIKANFANPVSRKNKEEIENNSSGKVAKKTQQANKNDLNPKLSVEDIELQNSGYQTQTKEEWDDSLQDEAENNNENNDIESTESYIKGFPVMVKQESILEPKSATLSPLKSFKIGGITIQTREPVVESDIATAVLLELKPQEDFKQNQVIDELESSITYPKQESSSITYPKLESLDGQEQEIEDPLASPTSFLPIERYQSEMRCQKRHLNLPEYEADGLIKEGDTFSSIEAFARYAASHALKWCYYYQIHDSRNVKSSNRYNSNKKTWYNFSCRFDKGRYKSQSTGARKVKQKTIQCPATISMLCEPGEAEFKVTYACHHHTHELSSEIFSQEAHGHRLPSEMKEEIRELVWYKVDSRVIRQYLLEKTGFDLKRTIINTLSKMRKDQIKLSIPPEREKKIMHKIEVIKQKFAIPKRAPRNKYKTQEEEESKYSESDDEENNESRVEARLNNILYDQALIQSVRELQKTTGCEIQIDTWEDMNNGESVSHLQEGLIEDTKNNEHDGEENTEDQVEVDEEQYIMDEHVDDITQTDDSIALFDEDNTVQADSKREVGVQVDEILELGREFEYIKKLESSMLETSEEPHQNAFSACTRGRPKVVLEEDIINRYNIEFYLNVGGVIPCLENLALNMNVSVLDLLKELYQGQAVFKMSMGRSGKQARKTVELKYLPLTVTFQFEQFKCINVLQQYKKICSKYCDLAVKLENTVETLSADLNATNKRLDMIVSQNEELLKVKKCYDDIEVSNVMKDQLLKQSQLHLAEAQAENQVLLQKITELEALRLIYQNKDDDILKQLEEPPLDCQSSNKSSKGHTIQYQGSPILNGTPMLRNLSEPKSKCHKNNPKTEIKMLDDKTLTNRKIIEKIKTLQETVKVSDAVINRYKNIILSHEKKILSLSSGSQ